MIVLYHENNKVREIWNSTSLQNIPSNESRISKQLLALAEKYPKELLVWCKQQLKEQLNVEELRSIFHNKNITASYNVSEENYLTDAIGYVNESPFININKEVVYPTWLMSSDVGGINAEVLLMLKAQLVFDSNFDYFLNSMTKLAMPLGLFCYSNPKLLKEKPENKKGKSSKKSLFRFIKQHYKPIWVFILLFDFVLYEKKFPFLAFVSSLFYKQRSISDNILDHLNSERFNSINNKNMDVDVIIPTIGRKKYLYDVLKDLSFQTHLPKRVIIVEQNPVLNSSSELDYLAIEDWPFEIIHKFINKTGVCNARNLALKLVRSDYVFLGDDDNRFNTTLLDDVLNFMINNKIKVCTTNYLQANESQEISNIMQWSTFGAGNSFMESNLIDEVNFDTNFEFGYGEDADFGAQLRNKGHDIIYNPRITILHLKAPMGGFRVKFTQEWEQDFVLPKPSPTVMLYLIKHQTLKQILGYKTILFLKYYRDQDIRNPFKYFNTFNKQWNRSQFWANTLKDRDSA